jgi:phosphoglycerol transferase MdoB-like AlkP superfamily enzyme
MWHASDQALFSMGMKVLRSEATSDTPFYSMFITESSHTPFVAVPQSRWPLKLSAKDANSYSGRYVGSISYTDKAFGEFFSALKSSGLWDNSIIVIYGDHSALLDKMASKGDPLIGDKLLGRPYSDVDRQRIPLIIHLPGQTAGRVENQTVGQVDIMPTIADLVGLDLADVPHVGRSVFKGAPSMIPTRAYLPGGSVVDDKVLFMPQLSFADGSAVNVQTGQSVQPSPAEQTAYENAKKLSALSDAWVRSLPKRADAKGNGNAILPH